MIPTTDTYTLTDFTLNAPAYVQQIKATKCPMAITVNGAVHVIIQDAESFQQLTDEVRHARFAAATRQSEATVKDCQAQGLDKAFSDILDSLTF